MTTDRLPSRPDDVFDAVRRDVGLTHTFKMVVPTRERRRRLLGESGPGPLDL